jgi:membrane-associated phospholipid phosphatase
VRPRYAALLGILVVSAALAVLFGLYDLKIARSVVRPGSGWARFVADWGELPGLMVIVAGLCVLSARLRTRGGGRGDRATRVGLAVLAVGALLHGAYVISTGLGGPAPLRTEPVTALVLGGLVGALGHFWVGRHPWRPSGPALAFGRTTLWLALVNVIVFVHVVKPLWGRVRFRDLEPGFTDFTAWYIPQGVTGHTSFPSGHTALGWMLLPLIPLALSRRVGVRVAVAALAVGWGLFVAAGRVRLGAHYPSDVLFSTVVAWATFVVVARRDLQKAEERRLAAEG